MSKEIRLHRITISDDTLKFIAFSLGWVFGALTNDEKKADEFQLATMQMFNDYESMNEIMKEINKEICSERLD